MHDSDTALSAIDRRLHLALLQALLTVGVLPSPETLAAAAGITQAELPEHLAALVAADYLAYDAAGRPFCLYPLSLVPTPYVVVIDGARRSAMCAIDALGVAAMLGRAVVIEGSCARCRLPLELRVRPGRVTLAEPPETVVVARWSDDGPAVEVCCPVTVFACGPAHGGALAARTPGAGVLTLPEALARGEALFGGLLAETLPAKRRRSPADGDAS